MAAGEGLPAPHPARMEGAGGTLRKLASGPVAV